MNLSGTRQYLGGPIKTAINGDNRSQMPQPLNQFQQTSGQFLVEKKTCNHAVLWMILKNVNKIEYCFIMKSVVLEIIMNFSCTKIELIYTYCCHFAVQIRHKNSFFCIMMH